MARNSLMSPIEAALAKAPSFGLPEGFQAPAKQVKPWAGGEVPFQSIFDSASKQQGVPVNVLMALAQQESDFDPVALGQPTKFGQAKGIMQYIDSTASGLGINPYDPEQAINAAAKQLRERLDKGYSMDEAVSAHFGGDDRTQWGSKTRAYSQQVMQRAQNFGDYLATLQTPQQPQQAAGSPGQRDYAAEFPAAQSAMENMQQNELRTAAIGDDKLLADMNKDEPGRFRLPTAEETAKFMQSQQEGSTPPAAAKKEENKGDPNANIFTDIGNLLDNGLTIAAQGVTELVGKIPMVGKPIVNAMDRFDRWANNGKGTEELNKLAIETNEKQMSPDMVRARKKMMVVEPGDINPDGSVAKEWSFGPAWSDPYFYISGIAESLPEMGLTMGGAGRLAKMAYSSAIKGGLGAEVAAARAARTATVAGGFLEGGLGGAQSSRKTREEIMGMTKEQLKDSTAMKSLMDGGKSFEDARKEIAENAASKAFLLAGVGTGIFGGMGDRALAKIITGQAGGRLKASLMGAIGEGLFEELPQSTLQQMGENYAMQEANPNQKLMKGVANAAASGAAIGGLMGAGMGAAAPRTRESQQNGPEVDPDVIDGEVVPPAPEDGQPVPPTPEDVATAAAPSASRDDTGLSADAGAIERAMRGNAQQPDNSNGNFWAGEPGSTINISPKGDDSLTLTVNVEAYGQNGTVIVRDEGGTPYEITPADVDITPVGGVTVDPQLEAQQAGTDEAVLQQRQQEGDAALATVEQQDAAALANQPLQDVQPEAQQADTSELNDNQRKALQQITSALRDVSTDAEVNNALINVAQQLTGTSRTDLEDLARRAREDNWPEARMIEDAVSAHADRPLTAQSEEELRDRVRYLDRQAKQSGWTDMLTRQRKEVEKVLNAKVSQREQAEKEGNADGKNTTQETEVRNQTGQNDTTGRSNEQPGIAVAQEQQPDNGNPVLRGQEPAAQERSERGAVTGLESDVSGTSSSTGNRALTNDGGDIKWFASRENAEKHIAKRRLNGYEVVEVKPKRFEIHQTGTLTNEDTSAAAPKQDKAPVSGTAPGAKKAQTPVNPRTNRAKKLVGDVGQVITPDGDVGNLTAGGQYQITRIEKNGTIHVTNSETQGSTTITPAEMERARSRGVQFARKDVTAPATSSTAAERAVAVGGETIPYRTVSFDPALNGGVGGKVESTGTSPIINFGDRMMVLTTINGRKVPFYLSTGKGGKKDVAAGQWYPFFGIGEDGWINKTGGQEMADYYGSAELRQKAQELDKAFSGVNFDNVPKVSLGGAHIDAINAAFPNATDNGTAETLNNVRKSIDDVVKSVSKKEPAKDGEWVRFDDDSGTLLVPRDQMPQIKAEHRGALVNFLTARGITHTDETVPASSLKATQAEYSPERVAKAAERTEGDRAILVDNTGQILDGHHQWMAAKEKGEDIRVIRFDGDILDLLKLGKEFPSSTIDQASAQQNTEKANQKAEKAPQKAPKVNQDATKPDNGATPDAQRFAENKLFTADKVAAARARMKTKFSQLNTGLDPEMLVDGMTIAGAYIESGVRKFGDYAKAMTDDFGAGIKPYLLSFWEGARNYPGLDTEGMTSAQQSAAEHTALMQEPAAVTEPAPAPEPVVPVRDEAAAAARREAARQNRPTSGLDDMVSQFDAEVPANGNVTVMGEPGEAALGRTQPADVQRTESQREAGRSTPAGSEAANAAEMKAASSGNPLILEEMSLRQKIRNLESERTAHDRDQFRVRDQIGVQRSQVRTATRALANLREDVKLPRPDKFAMTVDGQTFEKRKEAGEAIAAQLNELNFNGVESAKLGNYGGFEMRADRVYQGTYVVTLAGKGEYQVSVPLDLIDPTGLSMRITNTVSDLAGGITAMETKLAESEKAIPQLEAQIKPWGKEEALADATARHREVIDQLRPSRYVAQEKAAESAPLPDTLASWKRITQTATSTKVTSDQLTKLTKLRQARDTDQMIKVMRDIERTNAENSSNPRRVLKKLEEAYKSGNFSPEGIRLARWLINKYPHVANQLELQLAQGSYQHDAGNYNIAQRLITLYSNFEGADGATVVAGDALTATHEIMHHLERMMPRDVQNGITDAWLDALSARMKEYDAQGDTVRSNLLADMVAGMYGNADALARARTAFMKGDLPYSDYQFASPSEYWAENASALIRDKANAANASWIKKAIAFVKAVMARLNELVNGRTSKPGVIDQALNDILAGKGEDRSYDMLIRVGEDRFSLSSVFQGDYQAADLPSMRSGMDPRPNLPSEESQNRTLGEWWKGFKLSDKVTDSMQEGLMVIPFRPLVEEMGRNLNGAKEYLRLKQSMDAMRNRWHAETDAVAQSWLKYRKSDPKENVELMDIMHEATLAQVDPSDSHYNSLLTPRDHDALAAARTGSPEDQAILTKAADDARKRQEWESLRARFNKISPAGRTIFRSVRDTYSKLADAYEGVLMSNMEKAMQVRVRQAERDYRHDMRRVTDEGLEGTARDAAVADAEKKLRAARTLNAWNRKARITQLRQQFEMNRLEGPYFPLARFGNLFVTVRKKATGKVESFSRFESAREQREFAELMKEDPEMLVQMGTLENPGDARGQVDANFVADIEDILADLPNAESVKDEVWQRYLETLPDHSIRKNRIHRTGRKGYTADALRAFGNSMFHGSHQLARLAHTFDMQEALASAREDAQNSKDPVRDGLVVNEIEKRHEFIMNPTGGALVAGISQAAFIYALAASPKAAVVNLSQTAIMGIPMLAAYDGKASGVVRAANQLTRALGDFTRGKGSAEKSTRLTPDERAAMKEAYDIGLIDRSQAHDLAGVGETGVEYSAAREKVMAKLAWMFHHTERLNREVTFLAAYRMARAKGEPHKSAILRANDLTWKIHFDYQNTSRPRLMHSDTMKALLVFRNFTINMLFRLFRDVHQSFKGDTPEVRKEARMQLAGTTGMMMLSAGITGTWGFGIMMVLASMFMDDDKDPEAELKKEMVDALGPMMAGIVLDGVPGYATGTNLSDSIGMKDLWFRSPSTQLEGKAEAEYWKSQLLGAAPSMADNIIRGWSMIQQGDVYRGIETIMPKAIKDPMKAFRFATEGAENMRGDKIVDEVGAWDVIRQALGFSPAKLAEQYEINNAGYNLQKTILSSRTRLMTAYAKADEKGDDAAIEKVEKDIDKFNEKYPEMEISPKSLSRSIRTREKNAEEAMGGMRYNRKLRDRIEEDQAPAIYR